MVELYLHSAICLYSIMLNYLSTETTLSSFCFECYSERCGEEKNLLSLPGIEPQFITCMAHSLTAILTELSELYNWNFSYSVYKNICFIK
jgi:hypothetical protein